MKRIYLDHSATTPIDPEVAELMKTFSLECYGNPSSVHYFGRLSRKAIEEARKQIAVLIGADQKEIIFTSGGTEADNLAIQGAAKAKARKGRHLITSSIEHHAVLDTFKYLAKNGYELTILPVDAEGLVSADDVAGAVRKDTILISIMHANNEVGSVQPISEIGKIAHDNGSLFHVDAVQSLGKLPIDVEKMNIDLLSVSSHKIYGPKGVGALYVRTGVRLAPTAFGGSQERKMRPGTENTPGIIGFGKACELSGQRMNEENRRLIRLRDKLINGLQSSISDIKLNGPTGDKRLPNNVNVSIPFVPGETLLLNLDMVGIAASAGSACTSGSTDPSHVLLAMGIDPEIAHGSLRFSLGLQNTEEEIDYVLQELPRIVNQIRNC
ncbi:MAG: cysteine desulfurase NifS [Syntrophomonadaceae bacterium]|nr:cysteine desulfurase NifS [Syntrophomonadaceae bacterium]